MWKVAMALAAECKWRRLWPEGTGQTKRYIFNVKKLF